MKPIVTSDAKPAITLPVAVLIVGLAAILVTANALAISAGLLSPSTVLGELSSVTLAASTWAAGYLRGLHTMPPVPPGSEWRAVPSYSPPPTEDQLLGRQPLPPPQPGIPSMHIDLADEHVTAPETPDAKGRAS